MGTKIERSLPPLRILLTEGSSTSARETLYSLGRGHTIDILDPSPFCQCRFSRMVRRWYRCPPYSKQPAEYLEFLIDRLRSERYDVLIPTHEQVYLAARFRDRLGQYAGLAVPDFAAVDRVMGKANFCRLLTELDLPQPDTAIVRTREELLQPWPLPAYVKVDHSTAGQGVRYVRNEDELQKATDEFQRAGWLDGEVEVLVQQPARGIKSSVSGVFQQGRLVGGYCDESGELGIGGSPMDRFSVLNPQALEGLRRVGERLAWHGAITIEYYYDEAADVLEYTECNPRIGETVNETLSGVNLCEQLVRVSLGEKVEPLPPGRAGVRTYKGFLVLMGKAIQGAGRGELLADFVHRWTHTGFYADGEDELTRPREDWLSLIPDLAVSLQTILWPASAQKRVTRTVENYSLSESAAHTIRTMSK